MAKIGNRSIMTGLWNELEFPDELAEKVRNYIENRNAGLPVKMVQVEFPSLDSDQREFIISGATPEEWADLDLDED